MHECTVFSKGPIVYYASGVWGGGRLYLEGGEILMLLDFRGVVFTVFKIPANCGNVGSGVSESEIMNISQGRMPPEPPTFTT